ncbi:hypothetical protein M9H77_36517 [Catharanthus roseus]|uniref:Uncharacterized protein n=1 Tax=Catharanthus roseus TaxID=4058 RepID=A0ACB9ZS10_CATRO|nr:hypothetical protein M9H77_36517 [Catharanthus roseus]
MEEEHQRKIAIFKYYEPRLGLASINVIIMYGMMNYRREHDEYHEDYDYGAHTHEGYNIGAYGKDDCDGRWRYLRSMNVFYGNGSNREEAIVQRRLMDNGDIVEHGDHFTFLNSLGTYLKRRYFIEFNSISCAIPRVDDCDFNIANCVSCLLGVEDRRSMEKEIGPSLEDLSVNLSLNPLFFIGSLMFDLSCYSFGNLDDTPLVELNIVHFAFEFDSNSLQHVCTITSIRGRRHSMEFEGQGKNVGGRLILCYGDLHCVFFQRVKILFTIECLLYDFGWELYGSSFHL